jgi:CheY-like chemotaxis protein
VDQRLLERLSGKVPLEKSAIFQKGLGCEACQYTGYSGRMGVFEVLTLTPSIKEVIVPNVASSTIRKAAERQGFQAMTLDGLHKAMQGMTTIEEVFRVVPPEVGDMLKELPEPTPAAEEKELSGTKDEPAISSLSSPQPKKILVVDDSEIILKIVRHILETENFLVITAADGLEALKLTFQEKPDLIITDYLMPKLDGIALIKKLKSQLTTRFIPLIMLTAKEEVDLEVQGIDAGADDYLTKPANPKRLVARVNRLLNR